MQITQVTRSLTLFWFCVKKPNFLHLLKADVLSLLQRDFLLFTAQFEAFRASLGTVTVGSHSFGHPLSIFVLFLAQSHLYHFHSWMAWSAQWGFSIPSLMRVGVSYQFIFFLPYEIRAFLKKFFVWVWFVLMLSQVWVEFLSKNT